MLRYSVTRPSWVYFRQAFFQKIWPAKSRTIWHIDGMSERNIMKEGMRKYSQVGQVTLYVGQVIACSIFLIGNSAFSTDAQEFKACLREQRVERDWPHQSIAPKVLLNDKFLGTIDSEMLVAITNAIKLWHKHASSNTTIYDKDVVEFVVNKIGKDEKYFAFALYTNSEKPVFCKCYKNKANYTDEYKNLAKLNRFMCDSQEVFATKKEQEHLYPKVIALFDIQVSLPPRYFVFMEYARGETIFLWMNRYTLSCASEEEQDLKNHLTRVGRQIGNYHALTVEKNDGFIYAVTHHDLHMANILYDFTEFRVSFVDNDKMGKNVYDLDLLSEDLGILFYWLPAALRRWIILSKQFSEKETADILERLQEFLIVLRNGYIPSFGKLGGEIKQMINVFVHESIQDPERNLTWHCNSNGIVRATK